MENINQSELNKLIRYGWLFLLAGLVINYIYRQVFHSIPIEKMILGSDMEGYYQYLAHFFIKDWELFDRMPWTIGYGEGKALSVFTCGVAILWTPFFLIAHFASIFLGLEANGYTHLYFGMVLVAGIVYTYIGLVFLYLFLRDFFNHRVSLITVVLIFLATNVFFYSILLGAGMSHVYSFAMVSAYLYFSNRFIKTPSLKYLILLGVPFALAVLIRPTNIISGLYLFLFGVYNAASFSERWRFWISNYKSVLILLLIGFIVFIPQMAYWHAVTGKFLVYSYQNYGFPYWTSPKIGVVLFGKYNGWFTYTPLMLLAVTGLIFQVIKRQMNSWAVLLIIVLCIYVNGSWWWPTFGAAVGQRAMIDYLPFMAAPLALGVQKSHDFSENTRVVIGILILIFIFYNIQFGFRYDAGQWWDTPMSWSKFFDVLKF